MTTSIVIGDSHGMLDRIRALEPYFATVDRVILCGDYVDRGPDPIGVLEYVAQIPNSIRLMGNHEWKYIKKIRKGHEAYPGEVQASEFKRFEAALEAATGGLTGRCKAYFKDDQLLVSHAPAAYWQHDLSAISFDRFLYGWVDKTRVDAKGFFYRYSLAEKYPNQTTERPVVFGHIHGEQIIVAKDIYCVDRCCGEPGGKLGAIILEGSNLVDQFEI